MIERLNDPCAAVPALFLNRPDVRQMLDALDLQGRTKQRSEICNRLLETADRIRHNAAKK